MKVTKDMLHEDLQPKYAVANALPKVMQYRWMLSLATFGMKLGMKGKNVDGLDCSQVHVPSREDDYSIRARVYKPCVSDGPHVSGAPQQKLPVMLYVHGGGYITGLPEIAHASIKGFIETRPCVVIAPDYRKAFTKPYPAGLNDCYDTLLWARDHADELGINPDQIIVAGHSGGGGLTAALTLKARDTGDFNIAFQMPIYPMIDDQQPKDPQRDLDSPAWNTVMNRIGWRAYLADLLAADAEIPAYAAPIRNTDYAGFPPTITFVGTLEPFYRETVQYVDALKQAGVHVAFKKYPKCFHGFEIFASDTAIGKDGLDFTYSKYAEFYDRYIDQAVLSGNFPSSTSARR